jgi:hypothetical protein
VVAGVAEVTVVEDSLLSVVVDFEYLAIKDADYPLEATYEFRFARQGVGWYLVVARLTRIS